MLISIAVIFFSVLIVKCSRSFFFNSRIMHSLFYVAAVSFPNQSTSKAKLYTIRHVTPCVKISGVVS